jgi:enoyl-CoA hydratase
MGIINYDQQDDIAIITMDDGKANAMNPEMISAVNEALDKAEQDAKSLVLTGRPGVFCGGFDLKVMSSGDADRRRMQSLGGARLLMRIYGFPKPFVVANSGHCIALGGFFLLAGDYRIGALGEFRIGFNEVAIGVGLPPFALMLANARLPTQHVGNAVINANLYAPEEAKDVGFFDEVVAPTEMMGRSIERARILAELDGDAFAGMKKALRSSDIERILAGLDD